MSNDAFSPAKDAAFGIGAAMRVSSAVSMMFAMIITTRKRVVSG